MRIRIVLFVWIYMLIYLLLASCAPGKHAGKPRSYVIYSNIQRVYQAEMRAKEARYRKCKMKLTYDKN